MNLLLKSLKPRRSFLGWLKIGLIMVVMVVVIFSYISWQLGRPAGGGEQNISFTIVLGHNLKQISSQLKEAGLIRSSFWFEFWVQLTNKEKKIGSGYYSLPANINIINLVYFLTGGMGSTGEEKIRIVEGWTIKQIAAYLEQVGIVRAGDFILAATEPASVGEIIGTGNFSVTKAKPAAASLEGYLFPDTYRIYQSSSSADIILKMVSILESKFPLEWRNKIVERGYSVHEALTLASIVEKEVASEIDRKKVADIFWRRLENNIALQADSTINYLTGKNDTAAQAQDLLIDSAYNTYKYRDLPPGPISNPSLSAIAAVVFPEANNYWYFLTDKSGQVIYSRTFAEHKAAKAKYLSD